jgi:hypothetical protein
MESREHDGVAIRTEVAVLLTRLADLHRRRADGGDERAIVERIRDARLHRVVVLSILRALREDLVRR